MKKTQTTRVARGLEFLPGGSRDVYKWLERLPPGLVLDVGAASGRAIKATLDASPQARVLAFEPFPGNFRFLDSTFGQDPRVKIIKKAVSNRNGSMKFYVSSVITKGTGSWVGMEGYSSLGHLIPDSHPHARDAITVDTCRLDDEAQEPVRLLKIDVQGGEFGVLDGAQQLFDRHGVELVLAEFMGDERIVSFLAKRSYTICDTEYISAGPAKPLNPADWRTLRTSVLSTGKTCIVATPLSAPEDPTAYCAWFKSEHRRYRSLWTDLVAIAPWSRLI